MVEIRNNLIEHDALFRKINPSFLNTEEITVPFKFDEESVSEK